MKSLAEIKIQLQAGRFEFTRHAFKRAIERNITDKEIKEASSTLEVIEDYSEDKYTPSCLLLGFTLNNRVLHIQVSKVDSDTTKIITLYEPKAERWTNHRRRKN